MKVLHEMEIIILSERTIIVNERIIILSEE